MALATETDPRQTVVDILNATSDSDYTGSKPSVIEKMEERERRIKLERQSNALYVWRVAEGEFGQFAAGASTYDETQVVQVEAWVPDDEAKAFEIAKDLRDHIWSTYGADNESSTAWHRIQPIADVDYRQEAAAGRTQQHVCAIQIRLTNARTP